MADTAILTEGLRRSFDDVEAVAGVDLDVKKGEIYGFLGPNGAGKTTVVRMLCTLLTPTSGRASIEGHDIEKDPDAVRLRIGVALQEAALDDKQTGRELLTLQARLYGLRPKDVAKRLDAVTSLVEIGGALDRRVGTYSGGMKRRLDLAAALIHNPDVLFLDEPTTGLDPMSRTRIWEEVRRLNRELNMTIFLTTQYLEEADALADRVGIMNLGKVVAEGTPEELKRTIGTDVIIAEINGDLGAAEQALASVEGVESVAAHQGELVVHAVDGAATLSPVAVALNKASIGVRNLSLRTPTLDDVFLEITGDHFQEDAPLPGTSTEGQDL